MKAVRTVWAWAWFLTFYIPDRRNGWTHDDLVNLRKLAQKYGW